MNLPIDHLMIVENIAPPITIKTLRKSQYIIRLPESAITMTTRIVPPASPIIVAKSTGIPSVVGKCTNKILVGSCGSSKDAKFTYFSIFPAR
jgi:hypothetical protein